MLIRYAALVSLTIVLGILPVAAVHADKLVFGSFRAAENAANWAQKLTASLGLEVVAVTVSRDGVLWHRVQTTDLSEQALVALQRRATNSGLTYWRLRIDGQAIESRNPLPTTAPRLTPPTRISKPPASERAEVMPALQSAPQAPPRASRPPDSRANVTTQFDLEVGLETRFFAEQSLLQQDRFSASISVMPEYYRAWQDDRQSFTFTPFARFDGNDSARSHVDIREMFYSYVGTNWDIHVGAKRIFWGVTEFNHLVDIINQTDLVENIDSEDKLGQPMLQVSLVQDWGIVDAYLLTGFRERTFPSEDGRLTVPFKISSDATYESGAQQYRSDFALRWSHHIGAFEVGIHHFSGTSRDPMFNLHLATGPLVVVPHYPVIDQSGLDAQAIYGDWAFKLEGMTRSGFGDRYAAFNLGMEKTLVGVLGSNADLGLVLEYMYDDRGEDAFNTLFENDIAFGGRLALNDFANTQALLGVIVDTERDNYTVSIEASRQLTDSWQLNLEGRLFGGGQTVSDYNSTLVLFDPEYKAAWLDNEDYLQVEIKKYF